MRYRHAAERDIPSASSVFATAIDGIDRQHGFLSRPTPSSPPSPQYSFWLAKNPEAFWVAESGGEVVGYTFSFLRGALWFLADLFILPQYQGNGIGGTLISKTLGSWRGKRIQNRALITPAFNRASASLYMRHDMFPRQPVYFATATRERVEEGLGGNVDVGLEAEDADSLERASGLLDDIHRRSLGVPAGWHNEYFMDVLKARCVVFRHNGKPEGYAMIQRSGRIGPLVVSSPDLFGDALTLALVSASESDSDAVTMLFPGTNRAASKIGIKCGFKIEYPLLFLSSLPMGDFENYLFHSPGLM